MRLVPTNGQGNFQRGVASLVILALLKKEDMYGYQLVQEFERGSGGRLATQEGSLYPVLYKLLDQGYISDRKELVGKRMTRIYYHLEPEGKAYLADLIREYESVTQGVLQIIRDRGETHGDE
jgi:PadR family transcriptional regulator PadR